MKLLFIAIFSLTSFADLREHFISDGPGPRRHCNQDTVRHCRNEHAALVGAQHALMGEIDGLILPLERDKSKLIARGTSIEREARSIETSIRLAELEIELKTQKNISPSTALLLEGPAPEEVQVLSNRPLEWGELHGKIRRERLRQIADQMGEKLTSVNLNLQKIVSEIGILEGEKLGLLGQKENHSRNASSHASMRDVGCQQVHCPDF